jgi:hypothetical protein
VEDLTVDTDRLDIEVPLFVDTELDVELEDVELEVEVDASFSSGSGGRPVPAKYAYGVSPMSSAARRGPMADGVKCSMN